MLLLFWTTGFPTFEACGRQPGSAIPGARTAARPHLRNAKRCSKDARSGCGLTATCSPTTARHDPIGPDHIAGRFDRLAKKTALSSSSRKQNSGRSKRGGTKTITERGASDSGIACCNIQPSMRNPERCCDGLQVRGTCQSCPRAQRPAPKRCAGVHLQPGCARFCRARRAVGGAAGSGVRREPSR
jgi:hypothetical protein